MIEQMTEKDPGAIILTAAGQEYTKSCRIIGTLWVGGTTSGDRVLLKGRTRSKNSVFFPGQTDSSNTYLGGIWGWPGLHAPDGFKVEVLDSGTLYVFLSE